MMAKNNEFVGVRISSRTRYALERLARRNGLSLSAMLRRLIEREATL
jgi:hypothetical protein